MANQLDIFGVKFKAEDVGEFVKNVDSLVSAMTRVFDALAKVNEQTKKTNTALESQTKSLKKVSEYSKNTEAVISALAKTVKAGDVAMQHISDTVKASADVIARLRVQVGLTEGSLIKENAVVSEASKRLKIFDTTADLTQISLAVLKGEVQLNEKSIAKYLSTLTKGNVVIKTHAIQMENLSQIEKQLQQEGKALEQSFTKLNKLGTDGAAKFKELQAAYLNQSKTIKQVSEETEKYISTKKKLSQAHAIAEKELRKLIKTNADMIVGNKELETRLNIVRGTLNNSRSTVSSYEDAINSLKVAFSNARKELNKDLQTEENLKKFSRSFSEATKSSNALTAKYKELLTAINNGLPYTEAAQKMGKFIAEQKKVEKESKNVAIALERMNEVHKKIGNDPRFVQQLINIAMALHNGEINGLNAAKAFDKIGKAFDANAAKIEKARIVIKGLEVAFGHLRNEGTTWANKFNDIIARVKNLTLSATEAKIEIKKLQDEMRMAGVNTKKIFPADEARKFEQNVRSLIGSNQKLAQTFTELKAQVLAGTLSAKQATAEFNRLRGAADKATGGFHLMQSALSRISYRAISAVEFAIYDAIKAISIYDQTLKSLQAITGATDVAVTAMGEKLKIVSVNTRASLDDIAKGMQFLGQAGLNAAESIAAIEAVGSLATGTLEDVAKVADLVSSTMRAFNIEAIDSTRIVDVMANAINKSKLDVDKLRVAFSYVGVTANQVGLSLEETAATMMVLADAGVRASTLGTGLRQILARLESPSRRLREAFVELGMEVNQFSIKEVGMEKVLQNLSKVLTISETGAIDTGKAYKLFGVWAANSAVRIVDAFNSGQYRKSLDNVQRTGASAEMAAKQMEGLDSRLKNLRYTLEVVFIELLGNENMLGFWKATITAIKELVISFGKLAAIMMDMGKIANTLMQTDFFTGKAILGAKSTWDNLKDTLDKTSKALDLLNFMLMSPENQLKTLNALMQRNSLEFTHNSSVIQLMIEKIQKLDKEQENLLYTDFSIQQILKQLKDTYPELTKKIDSYGYSVGGVVLMLEELRAEFNDKAILNSISSFIVLRSEMNKITDAARKKGQNLADLNGVITNTGEALAAAAKTSREYVTKQLEMDEIISRLTQTINNNVKAGKQQDAQIAAVRKSFIDAKIPIEEVDDLIEELTNNLKKVKISDEKKLNDEVALLKSTLVEMSSSWNAFYDRLSYKEKATFLESAKGLIEKQANFEKYLEAINATDAVKTRMRQEFELNAIQEQSKAVIEERIKRGKAEVSATTASALERNEAELKLIQKLKKQVLEDKSDTLTEINYMEQQAEMTLWNDKELSTDVRLKKIEALRALYAGKRIIAEGSIQTQLEILAKKERDVTERISKEKVDIFKQETAKRENELKAQINKIEVAELKGVTSTKDANSQKAALYKNFYSARIKELEDFIADYEKNHKDEVDVIADLRSQLAELYKKQAETELGITKETQKDKEKIISQSEKRIKAEKTAALAEIDLQVKKETLTETQAAIDRAKVVVASAKEEVEIANLKLNLALENYKTDSDAYNEAVQNKKLALIDLESAQEDLKNKEKENQKQWEVAITRTNEAIKYQGTLLHETLNKMASFLSKGQNPSVHNKYQMKIFNETAAAFKELEKTAASYGITLDTNNKSFTESADLLKKKVELVNTYQTQLDTITESAKNLNDSVSEWTSGITTVENLKIKFNSAAIELDALLGKTRDFNQLIDTKLNTNITKIGENLTAATTILYNQLNDLNSELANSEVNREDQITKIMEAYQKLSEIGTSYISELQSEYESLSTTNNDLTDSINDIRKSYVDLSEEVGKLSNSGVFVSISQGQSQIASSAASISNELLKLGEINENVGNKIRDSWFSIKSEYDDSLRGIKSIINAHKNLSSVTAEEMQTLKENITTAYSEIYESIKTKISDMKDLWEGLKDKIIEINDKIKGIQTSTEDAIRDLRQKTMSEEEKYQDDRKKYEELVSKAKQAEAKKQYDTAEGYYTQAAELAKSLAIEVVDTNGNIVQSLESSIETSIAMLQSVANAQTAMLEKQRAEVASDYKKAESAIDSMLVLSGNAAKEYENVMAKAQDLIIQKQKQLTEEIYKTNVALQEMVALLERQLQPKAVAINNIGPKRYGFDKGGHVRVPGAPTNRDTIPAMLANNEFVMNPKSVAKYGVGFFNALNNMAIPNDFMQGLIASLSKMKSGINGYLNGGLVKPQFGFAGGGLVGSTNNTNNSNVYNYTGNFTINGAGKQAKELAIEVDKILTDRAKYNRSSFYKMVG